MRYVIDASVSARWFLPTVLSARAVQLRADYQNGVHELLAPETILWETCNALIKAERQSILLPGQAPLFFLDFSFHAADPLRGCFPGPAGDGDCPPDPRGTLRLHVHRPSSAGALRIRHRRSEAREQSPAAFFLYHTPLIPALTGGRASSTNGSAENLRASAGD